MSYDINGSTTANPALATLLYNSPVMMQASAWNSTEVTSEYYFLHNGTIKNLVVTLIKAPGVGKTRTYEIYKNGIATGLSVTISGTNTTNSNTTVAFNVAPNDYITIGHTSTGTPTDATMTTIGMYCESDENYYQWCAGKNDNLLNDGTREYAFPIGAKEISVAWGVFANAKRGYIAHDATAVKMLVKLSGTPGVGKSYAFVIYKGGVAQDGSGGTPDTRCTIADNATIGTISFTMDIVPGNDLSVSYVSSGTPSVRVASWAILIRPDVEGEQAYSATCATPSTSAVTYYRYIWPGLAGGTEPNSQIVFPVKSYLRKFNCFVTAAPGAGKSRTQKWRKNVTTDMLTLVIANAAVSNSDNISTVLFDAGETITMSTTPSGTPAAANLITYGVIYIPPVKAPIIL